MVGVFVLHKAVFMNAAVADVKVTVNAAELGCNTAAVTNLAWANFGFIPQFILKTSNKKVDRKLCDPSPGDAHISATLRATKHAPSARGEEEALDAITAYGVMAGKEAGVIKFIHAHWTLQ